MESVASCTSFISSRTQQLFRRFFIWLGKNIYLHYAWFIALGLFLTMLSTAGGITYYMLKCDNIDCNESRGFYLWIPRQATVWSQFEEIIEVFGTYPSKMSLLLNSADRDESVIIPSNMDISYNIFNTINNISLNYNNNKYDYDDLCLRSYPSSPSCDSTDSNFFGFFFTENDLLWFNESVIEQAVNTPNAPTGFFLGGFQYDPYDINTIIGATSLRIIYELEGSTNETIQDIIYEYLGSFQDYWSQHANDYANDIEVVYYTDRSFDDEISRVIQDDFPIFGLALFTMLIYLMFTLGKVSCIGARPWLAFSAVWVMICALAMGFSISLCLGTTFNTIVMLVPYILLGVGVDDMIILVDTYDKTAMPDDDILNAHVRLGNALASSGLSISLTSFCSSMAFFVGSTTDIPAISSFCFYAAWSFLANYLLQFLLFVPLLVIDDKRIRNKKNFCCPCLCAHDKKLHDKSQINFFDPEKMVKNNGSVSATKYKTDIEQTNKAIPENKRCIDKCNVEYLITITILPIMAKRICRIMIIILFFMALGGSVYVTRFINTESDATKIVPDDSYVLDFIDEVNEIYTGTIVDELQIIIENQDFSDQTVRDNINNLMVDMESQQDALGKTENWLRAFEEWLNIKNVAITDLDSNEFYSKLKHFTNSTTAWHSEITYDNFENPTQIKSTRFTLRVIKSGSVSGQYPQYIGWNAIFHDYLPSDSDGFAFVPEYCYAYLSESIVELTIDNMIFAGIGVFCVMILLLDLRMSLFIIIIVAMIDVNLFGWMWLLNVSLDTLSYSQCVMAVGLTVDYVIHITHAISDAKITDNLDSNNKIYIAKLKIALTEMGASVCKGAFTTFLGALALILSQSQAFRIFFYMFTGIITIAVAHGIILTPAILGELRFIYAGIDDQNEKSNKQQTSAVTLANLTLAQSVGNSNVSDFADRDNDYAATKPSKKNSQKELAPIMSKTSSGGDINAINGIGSDKIGQRTPIDDNKRKSIQMTNYNSKDSDDSSADPFEE